MRLMTHITIDPRGVDANMEFAPGTTLRGPVLFKQPFAGAAQLQPRAIHNQVQFVGSISPVVVNRQTGRTPAQRRMIGNRQIDIQQALLHGGFERRDGAVVESFTQRGRNRLARVGAFGGEI